MTYRYTTEAGPNCATTIPVTAKSHKQAKITARGIFLRTHTEDCTITSTNTRNIQR